MPNALPRIRLSYDYPQPIPLFLIARSMLCFLCSSSLCRLGLQAPALPGAAMQTRWGVVQLVGHLTVNEDGEGSNPSAPANSSLQNGGLTARTLARDGLAWKYPFQKENGATDCSAAPVKVR